VAFLDPVLDPTTRTVKVRLEFPNPDGDLRPEMFGEVMLRGATREGLKIPSDAVVPTGTTQVVFVALGEGRFQPREVRLGESDGKSVEVTSGLKAGEQVVTGANFLIDSESRLRASLAALAASSSGSTTASPPAAPPPASPPPAASSHEGH
jgi:membrane fusion protein, copper/silver efflux system